MYSHNILVAVDQLANTVLGGCPKDTISGRLGKNAKEGSRLARVACWIIGKVFFKNTRHCYE